MYYSAGTYESFAHPEKPKDVDKKSAYIIGTGLAGLTAAFYLVRDGQMKGEHIHLLEKLELAGGSCDGRCLPLEEQKALLEKRMIVLHEYLSGIQKQDTEEWEEQVSLYHVANLQRMTDIVLAEINGTERLIKVVTAK